MSNQSNLFIRNIPSIQKHDFKYRAHISSEQLNEAQHEAYEDILDLFNKANQLHKIVYEMDVAQQIESSCYAKRLEESLARVQQVEENYLNLTSNEGDFRYKTAFPYDGVTYNDGLDATVDVNTNDIIAHITTTTSKTKLYDETYDETLVPPSLQAFIGPDSFRVGTDIYSIEDSDINHALDGKMSTTWFRKIITSSSVDHIDNELVIVLPEDVITSRLINQIILHPFPLGFIDIMDVMYKTDGAWTRIPGFEKHDGCAEYIDHDIFGNETRYKCIRNATNLKFNFYDIQTNQLKIKFRQRNYDYDQLTNRRTWYIGVREVDCSYNIYSRDDSSFDMTYEFQEIDRNIKVYDAEVFYNNESQSKNGFNVTKEYFYYDDNGNIHKVSNTVPFILKGHKLLVRYHIEGNQETPNIYKTKIKYKLA